MTNSPTDQINQARSLVETAKEVVIALPVNPNFDCVAAALSLYLGFSVRGVVTSLICASAMTVEFSHLIGVDKVTKNLNGNHGKNLVISFPYQEGSIEKVSYNIENDTFNLVIEPREGYPIVTQDMIKFSQSGGNTDFIITIGASKLSDLDYLYNDNQQFFSSKPILNIDIDSQNTRFGRINIVDPNISSLSELTLSLFSNFGLQMNSDIATNLLAGITSGSQNFTSPQTQASSFEAAAMCIRSGARKITLGAKASAVVQPSPPVMPTFNKPINISKTQPAKQKSFQSQQPQPQKKQAGEAPPDWLKPKIYKGSTLL